MSAMITMSTTITTRMKTRSVTTLSFPASDCARNLVLCVQYEQWYARHDERRAQHSDWKRSPTVEKPSAYATHCKVSKVSVYPNHWCFEDGSLLLFAYVSQPCRLWSPVLFSTSKRKIRNVLPVLVHNMISKKKRSCRLSVFLSLRNLEPNKYHKTDKTTFEMSLYAHILAQADLKQRHAKRHSQKRNKLKID